MASCVTLDTWALVDLQFADFLPDRSYVHGIPRRLGDQDKMRSGHVSAECPISSQTHKDSTCAAQPPQTDLAHRTLNSPPAECAAGEQGLFRYAQEALLPRKSLLIVRSAGNLLLRPSGLLLLRP
jgi:hypothetical protein